MPLNNKATSFAFIPYQQPPISCARDYRLPKRRSKNVKWEKSAKYKLTKQKRSKRKAKTEASTTLNTSTPFLSSSITSESASSNTILRQLDPATMDSLDKDDAMLVVALLAYDPSIALVLDVNDN